MDNAPIHRSKLLNDIYKNIKVEFNAPYSPFLNPIEEFFSEVKNNFRKKNILST